ncbi:MAG: D-alanyl-D-alanine carboxypeptidase/D-alanyl-D-alanine-endopeptidase [Pseudomonadota bacterium]
MRRDLIGWVTMGLLFVLTACQTPLQSRLDAALANPEQTGIRWGLVVADMGGTELIAMRADDRFTPASNTKIVTTMATYHLLSTLEQNRFNPGTRVYLEPTIVDAPPNLVLHGGGDAMLSDAPDCEAHCLADLADAVAASGLTEVSALIGDDTFFPFDRWGIGWSIEDLRYYYGTAVSALSLNDNLVWIDVTPGAKVGDPTNIAWQAGDDVFALENNLETGDADSDRSIRVERHPGAQTVRVYGSIPVDSPSLSFGLATDNPAALVAARFKALLEARGISVTETTTRHRPLSLQDEAPEDGVEVATLVSLPEPPVGTLLATLRPSPLRDSLKRISKDSENLHAEIALRRLALLEGTGSRDHGRAALKAFLAEAGVSEQAITLQGGSGMSVYNRVSPRGLVQLLAYAARQPWFEDWLADQPTGGVDGSLKRRFKGTPLEGKIFAKTGTMNGANALAGVLETRSGRRLLFSIFANDRPPGTRSATPEMDAALVLIAETY